MHQFFSIIGFGFFMVSLQSILFCILGLPFLVFKHTKKLGVWLLGCSMIVPPSAIQRACNGCRSCDHCPVWNCAGHPTGRKYPRKS